MKFCEMHKMIVEFSYSTYSAESTVTASDEQVKSMLENTNETKKRSIQLSKCPKREFLTDFICSRGCTYDSQLDDVILGVM